MSMIDKQTTYEVLSDYYHHSTEQQHKALREALDRVPSVETAADCISRADVLDLIRLNREEEVKKSISAETERKSSVIRARHDAHVGFCDYLMENVAQLPSAQTKTQLSEEDTTSDCISRAEAIDAFLTELTKREQKNLLHTWSTVEVKYFITDMMEKLPSTQSDNSKYEYHYDHTDCIWYRPEARNRCPSTCAQYRDGWNDAMNYIFRDGEGYRPYRRDKTYE